jgi:hypothetical protein
MLNSAAGGNKRLTRRLKESIITAGGFAKSLKSLTIFFSHFGKLGVDAAEV